MPAVFVLLGLPLAVVLGMLGAGLGARICFVRAEPTFRCKVRFPGDLDEPLLPWPAHRSRARWLRDILLVQRGLLVPRTVALSARPPRREIRRTSSIEVRGLGGDPMVLTLTLDDGRLLEVATRAADLTTLAGPFLVAAIPSLPHAPREPRPHGRSPRTDGYP